MSPASNGHEARSPKTDDGGGDGETRAREINGADVEVLGTLRDSFSVSTARVDGAAAPQ
jgi:hypothetical protein